MTTRFGTRAFFLSFVPCAVVLAGSFFVIQGLVQNTVRGTLLSSLKNNQEAISRIRSRSELRNNRFLAVIGENPALKAGLQLLSTDPESAEARLTVEDQLRELCGGTGFDLLVVSNDSGRPLAGVIRTLGALRAIDPGQVMPPRKGLMLWNDEPFQIASVPVNLGDDYLGNLSVGERFDFAEFSAPSVLLQGTKVLRSNIPDVTPAQLEAALRDCRGTDGCEIRLGSDNYLSLPLQGLVFGNGYELRTLENIDAVNRPVQTVLRTVFVTAFSAAMLLALLASAASSRMIARPVSRLAAHLRQAEATALLPEFREEASGLREVRDLASGFNRAAEAIRTGREKLHRAYVEFTGSLASALDARDRYTAGHSRRVSEISVRLAEGLGLPEETVREVRVGALLHDIGKIGIADSILQKDSDLTTEEFRIVQSHPVIGRRILEGVEGFEPFLPAVELHHENWDGTGYPVGLSGTAVPQAARIVHVADAYDAMTTDRPYRRGMSHEQALALLTRHAGTQFDPEVVRVFETVFPHAREVRAVEEAVTV